MTRIEKIMMAVLILAIVATAVFWNDVKSVFGDRQERIADDEHQNEKKGKKDKKNKDDDKKKNDKDEVRKSFFLTSREMVG
jgi:F0F1-type ATP synthase membrane subunit b/b'